MQTLFKDAILTNVDKTGDKVAQTNGIPLSGHSGTATQLPGVTKVAVPGGEMPSELPTGDNLFKRTIG